MHFADVSVFLEFLFCFFGVLFFLGDEDYFRGIVLEEMGCYSETNACCAACYYVDLRFVSTMGLVWCMWIRGLRHLAAEVWNVVVGIEFVAGD